MAVVICMFTLLASLVLGQPAGTVYLGVLEAGGEGVQLNDGDQTLVRPQIKMVFRFEKGAWAAMPNASNERPFDQLAASYPLALSWTVALDGRRVGSVDTHRPDEFHFWHEMGIQLLTSRQDFPKIRKDRKEFISWMGTPDFRPLVALSQPNYADPDRWKPFHPTPDIVRKAYPVFRTVVGIRLDCSHDAVRHDYSDKLIQLSRKAYRSAKGDVLLELRTNHTCEDIPGEEWEEPVWFLLHDGTAKYIGRSLTLVDAGDYDGDGTSEVVFQYSGYNRGGYVLLHDHLTQVAQFTWSYH